MTVKIAQFPGGNDFVLCCDFCAKSKDEVRMLIASPANVHICSECVEICVEVIEQKDAEAERAEKVSE